MESTYDDENLSSYTDSYLCNHITSIPTPTLAGRAVPLSEKYFAKGYALREDLEDAVSAMKFASQLGIQVPHVHRIIRGDGLYCIMDRVPGTTLEIAWHELVQAHPRRDTYVNIFSDEADAGRMIHPAESEVVRGRRGRKTTNANTNANNAMTGELEDETQQPMDLESTPSTTGPPATPNPTETPKPSRKKTSKANEALKTAGTEANAIANARLRDPESQYHLYQTSKTSVEIFLS
ncbi:hypothetical protein E4U40_004095 [Claviceps sp. LM458 group G5]|nr:hypothetical protein E4U40_004095 [Claviceps sp. LM458 group G5]